MRGMFLVLAAGWMMLAATDDVLGQPKPVYDEKVQFRKWNGVDRKLEDAVEVEAYRKTPMAAKKPTFYLRMKASGVTKGSEFTDKDGIVWVILGGKPLDGVMCEVEKKTKE